jgi:hypothetical protein
MGISLVRLGKYAMYSFWAFCIKLPVYFFSDPIFEVVIFYVL